MPPKKRPFKKCCDKPKLIPYKIQHEPKPLKLPIEMAETIETLLLYMPLVDATQANQNGKLNEEDYGNEAFRQLLKMVGMNRERDVYIDSSSPDGNIDEKYVKDFERNVCMSCQKFVGRLDTGKESELGCFLRHIRNSLAHGNFFVHDDMLVGYDFNSKKGGFQGTRTAVYRIRPIQFVEAFQKTYAVNYLDFPQDVRESLVATIILANRFRDFGYAVTDAPKERPVDFLAEKNGKRYFVEYKAYKGIRFLHCDNVFQFLAMSMGLKENEWLVVVVDTSRTTKEVNLAMIPNHIIILDKPTVIRMLQGEDRLESVVENMLQKKP